ncbi:MAG: hypothetical protein ACO1OO_02640 [Flavisolibacter sp.]
MNTNKLFDLRFVIGCFFAIVGLLLLVFSFVTTEADVQSINRWCGIGFLVFGVVMILLSLQKDAHDELLEEE